MASSDESDKLATLMQARARLEAALATDVNWQALRESTGANAHDKVTAETTLQTHPLYRALKNVNAAIETIRSGSQGDGSSNAYGGPDREVAESADIPKKIEAGPQDDIVETGWSTPGAVTSGSLPADARDEFEMSAGTKSTETSISRDEASVTFVARAPRRQRPTRSLQDRPGDLAEEQPADPSAESPAADEAEVAIVSLAEKRRANAVERLLKALRGREDS